MFGIATARAKMHANKFINLLGEDACTWALSHKGFLYHNGQRIPYTTPFPENKSTTIGVLYNSNLGTLTYFKDNACLGLAFTGLQNIDQPIYACVSSTAARTQMTLVSILRIERR
jgi:SPRY domain-containing SOCS box protein 3